MSATSNRHNDRRTCLLVSCHPLQDSLCHHFVEHVRSRLNAREIDVEHLDLYRSGFEAPLSAAERRGYFAGAFDDSALREEIAMLARADILVLVFPTWWFGFPALLKGWFDRVWAPGVAFDHPADHADRIKPRLDKLTHCIAVTTLGSPWWFNRLILRQPLRRIIKWGLIRACAPEARFEMLSLYSAVEVDSRRLERFLARIDAALGRIAQA